MNSLADTLSFAALHGRLFKLYETAAEGDNTTPSILLGELENLAEQASVSGLANCDALIARYRRLITLASKTPRTAAPKPVAAQPDPEQLPLVLTSINPFGRGELQLRCFRKWLDLGFDAYTCNHGVEMEALTGLGIPADRIIQLGDHETGMDLFKKPVPKIRAVLARAEAMFDKDLLLVNSDLFPAAPDTGFLDIWRQTGDTLALTRAEVMSLDHAVDRVCRPYRGGLDAFLLPRPQLEKLLRDLELFPVSNRMCFGIVGWDYFVGAMLERRLKGTFTDSRVLLHEMHQPTYSNVDEFTHYLTSVHALGVGVGKNYVDTVAEYAAEIDRICGDNDRKLPPEDLQPDLPSGEDRMDAAQQALLEELQAKAPALVHTLGRSYVAALIMGVAARPLASFGDLVGQVQDSEYKRQFAQLLLFMILIVRLRPGRYEDATQEYPKGNMHAAALRMIRDNTVNNPDLRRLEVAKLFCTEAVDYKIFNPRLFNALALYCENDSERALISEIRTYFTGNVKDAA